MAFRALNEGQDDDLKIEPGQDEKSAPILRVCQVSTVNDDSKVDPCPCT